MGELNLEHYERIAKLEGSAFGPKLVLGLIDRIRELEQERDHYRMAAEAEARFADEARAKVRELEQDAARYRWLREEADRDYVEFNDILYEDARDLDTAIDAARGESNAG